MGLAVAVIALLGQLLQGQAGPPQQHIGHSGQGRPIDVYPVGGGANDVVIVGGIHGGYEANTSWLVWELLTYYRAAPTAIPRHLRLIFLPEANPDGLRNGTRFLADGV